MAPPPALDNLKDLTRIIQAAEGFHPVVAALKNGRSASIDGAWGSSAALAASALGLHVRGTLLLVIAYPRDLDSWADDVQSFAGLRPVLFPAWDSLPTDNLKPSTRSPASGCGSFGNSKGRSRRGWSWPPSRR